MNIFNKDEFSHCGWNVQAGGVYHRYCSRHICQNLHKEFKDKRVVKLVKAIMFQNQPRKFNVRINRLAQINPEAHQWLQDIGDDDQPHPELWSLSHDGGRRWGIMTTNGPESLNNVFKEARELPVTSLVEVTFYKCVRYFFERKQKAQEIVDNHFVYSKHTTDLIERRRLKENTHTVHPFRPEQRYEVITPERLVGTTIKGGRKHVVRMNGTRCTCTCLKPKLTGIPCSHVFAVCGTQGIQSNQFIHPYYRASVLLQTWSPDFNPFGNPDSWPRYNGPRMIPDSHKYVVKKGRRQHLRIRNDMDEMSQQRHPYTCRRCGQSGHSRRSCTAPINDEG